MEDNYKHKIEAVLFTIGKPVPIQRIAEVIGLGSIGIAKEKIEELIQEYRERDSALEIVQDNDNFRMTIKPHLLHLVKNLMSSTELDKPTQETLAVIAWKQPMLQADLVKIRGTSTYDHIKVLTEQGFITSEKSGRTRLIKLTQKFYDYFDTNRENIQTVLQEVRNKIVIPEISEPQESKVSE